MGNSEELSFVPTKSSRLKESSEAQFQSVVFTSYKKKRKPESMLENAVNSTKEDKSDELNMKRARHEVIKFGMSGFEGRKKEDARVQLAISLGAKPKKKHNWNYKRLQEFRKQEKLKSAEEQAMQQTGKNKLGFSNAKGKKFDKNLKKNKGLLNSYGKASLKLKAEIEGKSKRSRSDKE